LQSSDYLNTVFISEYMQLFYLLFYYCVLFLNLFNYSLAVLLFEYMETEKHGFYYVNFAPNRLWAQF
jgi:hypothetical protein